MRESLSIQKRALLERWKAGTRHREADVLSQREQRSEAPLTFGQERLWLLEQLFPGTSAFNLSFCCWIDGPLDLAALSSSAEALARRHDSIRTRIQSVEGVPLQVISDGPTPHLEITDFSGPGHAGEGEALRLATEAARETFDLEEGPLARMKAILVGEQRTLMLFVIHHAIADGWSLGVALRDLVAFYEATVRGKNPVLPPLPIQYGDYASWQRQPERDEEWHLHLDYWTTRLAEFPGFEIPSQTLRPRLQTFDGTCEEFALSEPLSSRIRALSKDLGVTPFMTLLAGFQSVLGRIAGLEDVAVATPVSGRTQEETYDVIGEFINILIMKTALSGNPTFRELILRVRETCIAAYAHQSVPMELVEASVSRPGARDASGTPFTQILFVLQNSPMPEFELAGGVRLMPVELDWGTARYDIELYLWDGRPAFTGRLQYRKDMVDRAFARRMCRRLEHLLAAAVADPEIRLYDLPLLTADEHAPISADLGRSKVLDAWLQPVPVGGVGEIHVSDVGVAQSYCGEAGLTAERFLPDPFSSLPGARLFATGDLGMRLEGGSIDPLVPVDEWKIGARPESLKVERILRDDPDLKDAALVTRITPRGSEAFAFVVPAHFGESTTEGSANGDVMPSGTSDEVDTRDLIERIRERLRARLAEHLIPHTFIVVPSLPLDAEGRINRAALRTGDPRQFAHAPRTRTERIIADTWQHALGLGWMPRGASWLELGASDAATAHALSVLRREFAAAIPLRALFEHPTVELLARHLDTARYAQLPAIRPRSRPASDIVGP